MTCKTNLNDKRIVSLPECVCSKYRLRRQRRWRTGRRRGQRSWKRRALLGYPFPSSPSEDGSVSLCLYNQHTSTCWDVKYLYSTDHSPQPSLIYYQYKRMLCWSSDTRTCSTINIALMEMEHHNQACPDSAMCWGVTWFPLEGRSRF